MSTVLEQLVKPYHQTDRFSLYEGDCRSVLPVFADCSFDSIVTDPPAGISFMGKDWDHHKGGRDQWVAWLTEVMRECLRVLKPGGHALVWAIPRTSHWTGWAIESAGLEIRDRVSHLFGSGFPKSLDVSKAIDAAAGAGREATGTNPNARPNSGRSGGIMGEARGAVFNTELTAPATDAAKQWNGWGTALKPACEDWWLCRKPLEGAVAQNVLKHGTGGLNIDGCRVASAEEIHAPQSDPQNRSGVVGMDLGISKANVAAFQEAQRLSVEKANQLGRWPANVIHDGSDEVLAGLPEAPSCGIYKNGRSEAEGSGDGVTYMTQKPQGTIYSGQTGSAARFFYCAKASQEDRNDGLEDLPIQSAGAVTDRKDGSAGLNSPRAGAGRTNGSRNSHPTVKPTDLMRYLCRLITPPGGLVLDPFCGSGSTGKAAMLEGFKFVGIELNAEYCQLAQRRIEAVTRQGLLFA